MATRSMVSANGSCGKQERGYALLILLLVATLLAIALAAIAPSIAQQMQRDKEEELIQRGIQYRRAVRTFVKHNSRFPQRIEDLDSSDGFRYLRKRYKDPITGGDFHLLRMTDIYAALNTAGAQPAAADTLSNSSASEALQQQTTIQPEDDQPQPGTVFYGVASRSRRKSIREFNNLNHYSQWLFFYDTGHEFPYEVKGPTPLVRPPALSAPPPTASPGTPTPNASPGTPPPTTSQ